MTKKRILTLFLTAALISSLAATSGFAGEGAPPDSGSESAGEQAAAGGDSATEKAPEGNGDSAGGEDAGAGDSAGAENAGGGDSAGGDSAGGSGGGDSASGAGGGAAATDTNIVTLIPEEMDELIIGAEGYEFTTDVITKKLEIDPAAQLTSKYPVIVFFEESDSVENGSVIGNVQFVSDYDEKIVVVHTNDVHGHLEVEPYVKGLADELKASGEYSLVLTVSAGDVYGGGEAVAGSYQGEFIPAIMDKIYDVTVPGNNDFGLKGAVKQDILLSKLYDHTQTLYANMEVYEDGLALGDYAASYESAIGNELFDELYDKVTTNEDGSLNLDALELKNLEQGDEALPDDTTFTTDKGTIVGVFGISTSGGAMDVDVESTSSIESSQACIDELRSLGAQVVIGVGHTGWTGEESTSYSVNDTNSWELANTVTGMDAFVDGHTHSIINEGQGVLIGEESTYVNQAQSYGECIGLMTLYVKDGEVIAVDGDIINDMEGITPDAEIQELVDAANARVKEDFGKPIAETPYFLNAERMSAANEGGSVRGNETNLGDLMTDIILAAASEKMGVDYAFVAYPGYWLRASVEPGDITLESIQSIFANVTVLYYDNYDAEEVLAMVERGLGSVYPQSEGQTFNQYSGLTLTYVNNEGVGTVKTITVGDTLIYDADNDGIQVDESWAVDCVLTMTGGEIDAYEGDMSEWICSDKSEVQMMVGDWIQSHTADDYTIYPNTVAPDNRIVEVNE